MRNEKMYFNYFLIPHFLFFIMDIKTTAIGGGQG
jgi:hypothetical protein